MSDKLCLITGVGPGTGSALVKRFAAGGYKVAMIARDQERLRELEQDIDNTVGYACDVSNAELLRSTADQIKADHGCPDVIIHNAYGGAFADFLEADPKVVELNFQINTMALLHLGQAFGEAMIERGSGAIIVTGNTSAFRGKAKFAAFAPTKAAQRILAESMARRLGPEGVHVAYVTIDAVIDVPWARKMFHDKSDDFFCKPADIADECFRVAHQAKSAWSFNVEIRPFGENW